MASSLALVGSSLLAVACASSAPAATPQPSATPRPAVAALQTPIVAITVQVPLPKVAPTQPPPTSGVVATQPPGAAPPPATAVPAKPTSLAPTPEPRPGSIDPGLATPIPASPTPQPTSAGTSPRPGAGTSPRTASADEPTVVYVSIIDGQRTVLTLRADGNMTVERGGARGTAFIDPPGLATIRQTFAAAGYLALPADIGSQGGTALASVTYVNDGVAKSVTVRGGADEPAQLRLIRGMLDGLMYAVMTA